MEVKLVLIDLLHVPLNIVEVLQSHSEVPLSQVREAHL